MPMLVVQIPPRRRSASRHAIAVAAPELAVREYRYAVASDGGTLLSEGSSAAGFLPQADEVVAVLAETDIAWHSIVVPQAPPARLRAALAGVVEESLLDEPASSHFALAPGASARQADWLAVVDRRWLLGELAWLEAAGVFVDRIVPAATPGAPARLHFSDSPAPGGEADVPPSLVWASEAGVATLTLDGGLARAVLPRPLPPEARVTATPAAAAQAQRWLDAPVAVQGVAERLLEAARSPWNLRQFELVRHARGWRALAETWRAFWTPAWRPVRLGVAALLAVQLIGINLDAARQRAALQAREREAVLLLQSTFPQVRAVLDAPLQMQREVQALRTQAGKPGDDDLEPMLSAAAAAWPAERPPVDSLRFEPGRLSLAAAGWQPAEVERFRGQLAPAGWQVDFAEGRLTLLRRSGAVSGLRRAPL